MSVFSVMIFCLFVSGVNFIFKLLLNVPVIKLKSLDPLLSNPAVSPVANMGY